MRKIDLTSFSVASSETARHINRRIALNFVRRHQPLSRADLARHSGLHRSTVSAIIDQLIAEGWVTEGAIGRAPRGRRPRFLHLNVERAGILGVELRPETTTVGLAGVDARFVAQTSWPTPADPAVFVEALVQTVAGLKAAHPHISCEGMGVSLPGRVDPSGRLMFAPNLGWGQIDLKQMLETALGLPVILENAANACALAELWFGRHPDHVKHLIAVTVSEGIGVGLLLNGQLMHGSGAMAGEFGHVTIDENGPPCRCGKRGCWERYASNSAAVQYYLGTDAHAPGADPAADRGTDARTDAHAFGTDPRTDSKTDDSRTGPGTDPRTDSRTGPRTDPGTNPGSGPGTSARSAAPSAPPRRVEDLLRLADSGDRRAVETIERMARFLGMGLAALVAGLAPDVIIIVGEVTGAWDRVGPIVADLVKRNALPHSTTRIVPTDRATQPRLRGAVTLVVQQHFGAPNVA